MLVGNYRFKQYLQFDEKKFFSKTHFIKKDNLGSNFKSGIIYLFNQKRKKPSWGDEISKLSKRTLNFSETKEYSALVFLKIYSHEQRRNFTFVLTFGGAQHHLNTQLIVQDFGLKISKSLITPENVSSIDSIAIDRKIYNIRKQSSALILPEKIHSRGEHTIVRKIYGKGNINKLISSGSGIDKVNIQVGGTAALNLTGKISFNPDFTAILSKMSDLYIQEKPEDQLFQVYDPIQPIQDKDICDELDRFLGKKIKAILSAASFDKRSLKGLIIQPQKLFELDSFNGFFISGVGYKEPHNREVSGDFSIDEVNYFERLKLFYTSKGLPSSDGRIILKLRQDKIKARYLDRDDSEVVCSIYQALSLETSFKDGQYILVDGKWYKVDKDYYRELKAFIDSLENGPTVNAPDYIAFDTTKHKDKNGTKREGLYNDDLVRHLKALKLDVTKFRPEAKIMRQLQLKMKSNIEICDVFLFTDSEVHFIHVKRHSGASGISHLLAQANASAQLYQEDRTSVVNFIQQEIKKHNEEGHLSGYSVLPFEDDNKKRLISLVIIDKGAFDKTKKVKRNSAALTLLEMISIRENIQTLKNMGYTCYLKFVDSNE